jgi:hypothetical protein
MHDKMGDVFIPFNTIYNFHQPSRNHVVCRGNFAPYFGKVSPLKDGYLFPIGILTFKNHAFHI